MKKTGAQLQLEERIKDLKDSGFDVLPDGDYQECLSGLLVTRWFIDNASAEEWDDEISLIYYSLNG